MILGLHDVTMQFGGVIAVNNLSMEVHKDEIVAIIGPNGAGKTTAFNVITGVYPPTNGSVSFHEETIIRNFPKGKMAKIYQGEQNGKYDKAIQKTPGSHVMMRALTSSIFSFNSRNSLQCQ